MPVIYDLNISATPGLRFINQPFTFNISATSATVFNYIFYYNDGNHDIKTTTSATHSYTNYGRFAFVGNVSASDGFGVKVFYPALTVNPLPVINISGSQIVNNNLNFNIFNSNLFLSGTVSAVNWNFGNGHTSANTNLSATVTNSYSATGSYTVSATAFDISGNIGTGILNVILFESDLCTTKTDYITLGGPVLAGRYGPCKQINLVNFLPQALQSTDVAAFLQVFEDFLNNMFPGYCGFQLSATDLPINEQFVSASTYNTNINDRNFTYNTPSVSAVKTDATSATDITISLPNNYLDPDPKISILEKIKRLTELQDPDLIDLQYINFFAKNLGYSVDISRDEVVGDLGNLASLEDPSLSAVDQGKYLRFVVSNLPNWYKIKSTNNAIKVMLYSFGLVGDLINLYTNNYLPSNAGGNWMSDIKGDLSEIPNDYYPTPHFAININIEDSTDVSFDISRKQSVIKAIESIRPVNTVFERLNGYIMFNANIFVEPQMRFQRYISITSDSSDFWNIP